MLRRFFILFLLLATGSVNADTMLMTRVPMKAEKAFAWLTSSIEEHGYSVAHIQTCDQGMADFGYKSDFYRVVFFGKGEEVRHISDKHPEFVAYLPLKIAVVAERGETVMSVVNPKTFLPYYQNDKDMQVQFGRWYNDLQSIFSDVQRAAGEPATAAVWH
jgi:uncharacterized protein (DUF302 family)